MPAAVVVVAGESDCQSSWEKRAGRHSSYSRCRSSSAALAVAAGVEQVVAACIWPAGAAGAVPAVEQEVAGIVQARARILWSGYSWVAAKACAGVGT